MLTNPMIRDVLTIDASLLLDLIPPGNETIFLLGRIVQFGTLPILPMRGRSLVIIADEYHGNGGDIWTSGTQGPEQKAGQNGVDGAAAPIQTHPDTGRPTGPGHYGTSGTDGSDGLPAQNITLFARRATKVRFTAEGTPGYPGGNAGHGGRGGDGWDGSTLPDGTNAGDGYPGTPGGPGGHGGKGGNGGSAGQITCITIEPVDAPEFMATPGQAGAGGRGAPNGADGKFSETSSCSPDDGIPCEGVDGAYGVPGNSPAVICTTVSEEEFKRQSSPLSALTDMSTTTTGRSSACAWASSTIGSSSRLPTIRRASASLPRESSTPRSSSSTTTQRPSGCGPS